MNTCGFIEAAKQESVERAARRRRERREGGRRGLPGRALRRVLAGRACPRRRCSASTTTGTSGPGWTAVLAGERRRAHEPRDRRKLLPIAPGGAVRGPRAATRPATARLRPGPDGMHGPAAGLAPASGPRTLRRRLAGGPVAPLKIASGCDRRCSFCAIPAFRGAFLSRPPEDLVAEADWLAGHGVRELVLVSENSTSYGKDLGDPRLLESCCPRWPRCRASTGSGSATSSPRKYAPALIEVMASTPGVAPYFDLSFQHASGRVLRAMRRFGDRERFGGAARPGQAGLSRRPASGPTSSSASPARPPPTSMSCSVSCPRRGWTRSASSATPTRRAPRPPPWPASSIRPRSPGGSTSWPGWPTS